MVWVLKTLDEFGLGSWDFVFPMSGEILNGKIGQGMN